MIRVQGMKNFERRIRRARNWQKHDQKNLKNAGRDALKVFVQNAKGNIKDFPRDIVVIRKSGRKTVPKGTLRRSIGYWPVQPRGNHMTAGPRAGFLNRRNFSERNDGWFAHIVEGGNAFGRRNNNRNKGVITKSMKSTRQGVSRKYLQNLKTAFPKYMR
jgi:hypothetical protein